LLFYSLPFRAKKISLFSDAVTDHFWNDLKKPFNLQKYSASWEIACEGFCHLQSQRVFAII